MLAVDDRIQVPLRELTFRYSRSSGPGGQHVNKTNTKATLRFDVAHTRSLPEDVRARLLERYPRRITASGELLISSQRFRDRGRNVADCLEKLRRLLASVSTPPRPRRKTRPSRASIERRMAEKRRRAARKTLRRPPATED